MKKLIILLFLMSLSGCSSSLVKDEKTSQKIELTKKLQDEVAINLDVRELPKSWIDSKTIGCCLYRVHGSYFHHENPEKILEVLEQRCGIGVRANVKASWDHDRMQPTFVEVGECSGTLED